MPGFFSEGIFTAVHIIIFKIGTLRNKPKPMELPKYILGDNTDFPDAIFVIHTEFPRFIINLENDEVEWFEEFDRNDQKELEEETENCIKGATEFYDREVARYNDA